MIDFTNVETADGRKLVHIECDCGWETYLPEEAISGCVKCPQCGTKSCSG